MWRSDKCIFKQQLFVKVVNLGFERFDVIVQFDWNPVSAFTAATGLVPQTRQYATLYAYLVRHSVDSNTDYDRCFAVLQQAALLDNEEDFHCFMLHLTYIFCGTKVLMFDEMHAMQISEYLCFTYQFVAFFSGSKKPRIWHDWNS